MKLKITDPRAWYLWIAAGLFAGIALAMLVKIPTNNYHGKAFWGCAPTYCVV